MANDVFGPRLKQCGGQGFYNLNDEWHLPGSTSAKQDFIAKKKEELEKKRQELADLKVKALEYPDAEVVSKIRILENRIIPNIASTIALEESRLNLR